VSYQSLAENPTQRRRVLESLGFDADPKRVGGGGGGSAQLREGAGKAAMGTEETLASLVSSCVKYIDWSDQGLLKGRLHGVFSDGCA
jgi:hypothetical protein